MNSIKPSLTSNLFFKLLKKLFIFITIYIAFEIWSILLAIITLVPVGIFGIEFTSKIIHSRPIILGFLYFIFAQGVLALGLALILTIITFLTSYLFSFTQKTTLRIGITLCALVLINVVLLNYYFFPWSLFAIFHHKPVSFIIVRWLLIPLNIFLLFVLILALVGLINWIIKTFTLRLYLWASPALILVIGIFGYLYFKPLLHPQYSTKPNIIIIGIDSLRPDYTGVYNKNSLLTPNIDRALANASLFENAYTPLARTAAAWVSILTGDDPKITGIRHNLFDPRKANFNYTLAHILQQHGYTTVYAIDDRRFNPVTKKYGFDKIIAPETGFNDFFLGSLNEKPLSNLIANTRLAAWLFPHTYSNRAIGATYRTETFVNYVRRVLSQTPQRPMFIGIHLTLVHWPLYWSDAPISLLAIANLQGRDIYTRLLFKKAVRTVDKQLGEIFVVLKENHLLDNALVIILSDHGESLGLPEDRLTKPQKYQPFKQKINPAIFQLISEPQYGHGTDVLSLTQYHIVLGMKVYGDSFKKFKINRVKLPTSLIDITPTILDFLNIPQPTAMQGISLLPYLTGTTPQDLNRYLFIESEVTLNALKTANPNIENLLEEGLKYFTVLPETGALIYKPSMEDLILRGKQRAVIHYPWILAAYPINPYQTILVIGNMETHEWSTELNSPLGKQANAHELYQKLHNFYGDEILQPIWY